MPSTGHVPLLVLRWPWPRGTAPAPTHGRDVLPREEGEVPRPKEGEQPCQKGTGTRLSPQAEPVPTHGRDVCAAVHPCVQGINAGKGSARVNV